MTTITPPPIPPEARRARLITTYEGKFMNVRDCAQALGDDAFIENCAGMLKHGIERGDAPLVALRAAIGNAFYILSGDCARRDGTPDKTP
jgi:hypothetical protein